MIRQLEGPDEVAAAKLGEMARVTLSRQKLPPGVCFQGQVGEGRRGGTLLRARGQGEVLLGGRWKKQLRRG